MWLMIIVGALFVILGCIVLLGLIQYIDAWLWHWWHYMLPHWKLKRAWRKRYREFERRNRW